MKVLEVISELDNGGVENLMLNYCSRINDGFDFTFTTYDAKEGKHEKDFLNIGKIVRLPRIHSGIVKCCKETKNCIINGKFDIVHIHQGYLGVIALYYAKKYKVKKIILHAHIAFLPEGIIKKLIRKRLTNYCLKSCKNFMACSKDAAEWMWGSRINATIMKNAVLPKMFAFSNDLRKCKRMELGITDRFVVGCVGRICDQKNPAFTLEVFSQLIRIRPNAYLLMIGNGDLEHEMKELAKTLGVSEAVLFMGTRTDVNELLNAMDVFLLPSKYEGLGIAYVEAQINGLKCFASREGVPQEAAIDGDMEFISLSEDASIWAKRINEIQDNDNRKSKVQEAIVSGYDIDTEAGKLKDYYLR